MEVTNAYLSEKINRTLTPDELHYFENMIDDEKSICPACTLPIFTDETADPVQLAKMVLKTCRPIEKNI
jgi:hypothetical protein